MEPNVRKAYYRTADGDIEICYEEAEETYEASDFESMPKFDFDDLLGD